MPDSQDHDDPEYQSDPGGDENYPGENAARAFHDDL